MNFNLNPLPWSSVKLKILPPLIDLNIIVATCPILGFFVFAETTMHINGAATLTTGFKNSFQAVCVPLKKVEVSFSSIHLRAHNDVV